jgi:hypothetical protein
MTCDALFSFFIKDRCEVNIFTIVMVSPLGTLLADLFMSNLELKLNRFSTSNLKYGLDMLMTFFAFLKNNRILMIF